LRQNEKLWICFSQEFCQVVCHTGLFTEAHGAVRHLYFLWTSRMVQAFNQKYYLRRRKEILVAKDYLLFGRCSAEDLYKPLQRLKGQVPL